MNQQLPQAGAPLAWQVFGAIEQARAAVSAQFFSPGRYVVRIDNVLLDKDRNQAEIFIVRTTVLAVLGTELGVDGQPKTPSSVGSNPSVVYKNDGAQRDMFLPNCKAAAACFADVPPDQVKPHHLVELTNTTPGLTFDFQDGRGPVPLAVQPAEGLVVEVSAREKRKVKKPDEIITNVSFVRLVPVVQVLNMVEDTVLGKYYDLNALRAAVEPTPAA